MRDRGVPVGAFRRKGPALEIGEGLLVGRDQAGAGAGFDGHVGDCHPPFHRQRGDGGTGVLDYVTGAGGGADLSDQRQDQVFRGAAERQRAVHGDPHALDRRLQQGLARHDVLDLRRADAEGERAEGAVRRRVAVAAYQGHTRQGEALFRTDDMDDAVTRIRHLEQRHAEGRAVAPQRIDLELRIRRDRLVSIGRDVMVDYRQGEIRPPHLPPGERQSFERLRARYFMNEMAVDIEQAGSVLLPVDQMAFPDFV